MKFTALTADDSASIVEAWNSWTDAPFQIDTRLLNQLTWEHSSWSLNKSLLVREDGRLAAFLLARNTETEIIIDALAVHPSFRRKGLGRSLIEKLGPRKLRFGGGPAHFLPGLPVEWTEAKNFLESLGFGKDYDAEDLYLKMAPRKSEFLSSSADVREAVVSMIREEFSARWTNDTAARFEAGDARDVIILKRNGEPVAFCQAWHYESQLLGPSVFWLRNSCEKFGGIGPVGVKAAYRGQGLGREIVLQALNYLHHRGAQEVVVDWTAIGPFYEKCGFTSWRKYQGLVREGEVS